MNLESDDPGPRNFGILFLEVDGQVIVEPNLDSVPMRSDSQFIPVILSQPFPNLGSLRGSHHLVAPRLIVQASPNRTPKCVSNVALVATHLGMPRDSFGSKLNTCVVPFSSEFGLESKFKITVPFLSAKKLIVRDGFVESARNDRITFDAKPSFVPFPTGQVLFVKEELKAFLESHRPRVLLLYRLARMSHLDRESK